MEKKKAVWMARAAIAYLALSLLTAVVLFASSGTFAWPGPWILAGAEILYFALMATVGLAFFPETVLGRASTKFVHRWDKIALLVYSIGYYSQYLVAGFDQRFGLSGFPAALFPLGIFLYASGLALTLWVLAANPYAIGSARIQEDRGQVLVSAGPYRFLRHPMYFATLLFVLGTSIILDSPLALCLAPVSVGAFVYRCSREDRMLKERLPGYADYARKVKYRMFPLLW